MGRFEERVISPILGINEDENPHSLRRGELVEGGGFNCASYGNEVGTRPGVQGLAASSDYEDKLPQVAAANVPIQGAYEYRTNFDDVTTRKLLLLAESNTANAFVFRDDTNVYPAGGSPPTWTAGADNFWTMAGYQNQVFAAGGASGDDFWYLDAGTTTNNPTAINVVDSASATLRPTYVYAYRNYLLLGGLRGGTLPDNNPAVHRFCDFGTDATDPVNWSVGNTIGFNTGGVLSKNLSDSYGVNYSTGFAQYRDNEGDFLLLLGNRQILAAVLDPSSDFRITDAIATGCVGQRAYVNLGLDSGEGVYLSSQGIHSLRQSQTHGFRADKFLSWKVRRTFATANQSRLRFSVGAYDFVNGWLIFAITTGSNTSLDTLLVLDVKQSNQLDAESARWYVWKIASGFRLNDLAFLRDANDDYKLYLFSQGGRVAALSTSVFSDIDDDGANSAYQVKISTKHDDEGTATNRKTVGDVHITLSPGGNYTPTYRTIFDYGQKLGTGKPLSMPAPGGFTLGSDTLGSGVLGADRVNRDDRVYSSGSGRTIGHEINHSAQDQPFFVSKIAYEVRLSGESQGDSSNA